MRVRALGIAIAIAACAGGCAQTVPRNTVLGQLPSTDTPDEMWNETLTAVRALGYRPTEWDRTTGTVAIPSNGRRDVTFALQIYREGWVRVRVEGNGLLRWNQTTGADVKLPAGIAAEYRELAMNLTTGLFPPAEDDGDEEEEEAEDGEDGEDPVSDTPTEEAHEEAS